ncbi:G-protein alpha subunit [Schizopora paradoxa]|uniref:G-protein alpha subunit n=1 Tax=Schizopora paradoxa TaxID=27342 RepID=A0A0H2RXY6_9AGAM|nr:G-protein alpha subunit [Schizopora paradoxa]
MTSSNGVGHRQSIDDPFARLTRAPTHETPDERSRRLEMEEMAARRNREIEDGLVETKKLMERRRRAIKVLLLGQAESGKSTTLRNFQLTFAPSQFHAERSAWRYVIQLNLVQSVRVILDVLNAEIDPATPLSPGLPHRANSITPRLPLLAAAPSPTSSNQHQHHQPLSGARLTNEHRKLILRLGALLAIEPLLQACIDPDYAARSVLAASSPPPSSRIDGDNSPAGSIAYALRAKASREIVVRPGAGWKRFTSAAKRFSKDKSVEAAEKERVMDEPTAVLSACREDIIALWNDDAVRDILRRRGIDVEHMPGFFLNDAVRIATTNYEPTDDDILRARLRTLGVEEHHLKMENHTSIIDSTRDWIIYDVGGCRGNRDKWVPYFDDITAIIFLAPLLFTQTLAEAPTINRLEDTIALWKKICANPLLQRATIVLFLNKMDILERTLESGVKLSDYVPSYGVDAPNDVKNVKKYFRNKLKAFQKAFSPQPRYFYCHETSVIDSRSTSVILITVREGILHNNLVEANVL